MRLSILATALLVSSALAQDPAPRPLDLRSPVQDKNFYVLSLLERTPGAVKAINDSRPLGDLIIRKRGAVEQAAKGCKTVSCVDSLMRWTDAEITTAGEALKKAYKTDDAVRKFVDETLRESGAYVRYASKAGDELLAQAWTDAARGMNQAIEVYGEGNKALASSIDGPAFDVKSENYAGMAHTTAEMLVEQIPEMKLFFQPTLRFALYMMDINKRDEAGRLEPMEQKENAAAIRRIRTIDWSRYPYTSILAPGHGADRLTWALTPSGKQIVEITARRWREGKAPFIITSGGYVHPNQTPYSEAVEMKRSLMNDFGVPENAIIIDPHARHTTTNLRNAAREMYRYGIPFDRPALISTDPQSSEYIGSEGFAKRCDSELGYRPHRIVKRISVFDLEWLPMIESLQIDAARDLLDP